MLFRKKKAKKKTGFYQKGSWYFVMFAKDFLDNSPYNFTLYGEPFILDKDRDGKLVCYLLPLWEETKFSNDACIQSFLVVEKQGIIWFWRGQKELADENLITAMNSLRQPVKYHEEKIDD